MTPGTPSRRANTFFALQPPPAIAEAVEQLQVRLARDLPAGVRPIPPANYHITLAFLGTVDEAAMPTLRGVADGLSMPTARFALDRLGRFPPARVGWLGCTEISPSLGDFQEELTASLRAAGFTLDERPWVPHLTLYRNLRTALPKVVPDPLGWRCESFVLLRTDSGKAGPVYRIQGRWKAR